ncbi:MAG TPA: hypothetical protein VMI54_22610 [Polyangiaceae bacterium]|nr:hypothetical protein [Polyangiaceae bacterium]
MSKHTQDEATDAPPDSGTERQRQRAEPAAEEFETEEERRFFSAPPEGDEEHTLPSLEPVVAEAGYDEHERPAVSAEQREWLARAEARRATLQRWVGLAMVAGVMGLVVAGADRYMSTQNATLRAAVSSVSPAPAQEPPKKTSAATGTSHAQGETGAPGATSIPVALAKDSSVAPSAPSSAPSATSVPVAEPPAPPSATSVPVTLPASPSATSVPVLAPPPTADVASTSSPGPAPSERSAPPAATDDAPAVTPAPSVAPVAAGAADAAGLRDKARTLLATGHSRDGVAFARAAVESDPLDARSYVLLGAGLQNLGDWAAARGVFEECTRKATHGGSSACQYFARR